MLKNPKISIIIPIYNVEKYLSRCLESVINQTLLDIEIICVNDGTKDGSVDIVKMYMAQDDRIRLIEKENGGIASARNFGIKVANGDMLVFLDSDDYLALNACERIYEEKLNKNADILVFASQPFPEIPPINGWLLWNLNCRDVYYPEFKPEALFNEASGNPFVWDRAFSREFLEKNDLRFREDVFFGEDIIFIMEAAPIANGIQFISDKLHFYQCYREGSFMHVYNKDIERKLKQHVKNMRDITSYWYEKGLLDKWGDAYLNWYVDFIVNDLTTYKPENQQQLAKDVVKMMDEFGLVQWKEKASVEVREKCKILNRIAAK